MMQTTILDLSPASHLYQLGTGGVFTPSNKLYGSAYCDVPGRYTLVHQGASSDYRPSADSDALENDGVQAYPDIVLDNDGIAESSLLPDGNIAAIGVMRNSAYGGSRCDQDIATNGDVTVPVDQAQRTQRGSVADDNLTFIAGDQGGIADANAITDHYSGITLCIGFKNHISADTTKIPDAYILRILKISPFFDDAFLTQSAEAMAIVA
jgi:hypothetical protein